MRQHPQLQPPRRAQPDPGGASLLGHRDARGRVPLRPGLDPRARRATARCCPNPPLLEAIAADPVLAHTKLIAEAWDAAGLYQVGSFPSWGRWAEWNGRFRDELRRFVKSDAGLTAHAPATRLAGSPDLYRGSARAPYHSINFVTSHDGFTLRRPRVLQRKHNWPNGEKNTDGHRRQPVVELRRRGPDGRSRGARAPRAPDPELPGPAASSPRACPCCSRRRRDAAAPSGATTTPTARTTRTSWLDWRLAERERRRSSASSERLVRFREAHPSLRRRTLLRGRRAARRRRWHGAKGGDPDSGRFALPGPPCCAAAAATTTSTSWSMPTGSPRPSRCRSSGRPRLAALPRHVARGRPPTSPSRARKSALAPPGDLLRWLRARSWSWSAAERGYFSRMAKRRVGPPLPPARLMGATITVKPLGGSPVRFVAFSM